MELQDYLNVVKRFSTVILVSTLIGGILGAALTFLVPREAPLYTSTVQGVLLTNQGAINLQGLVEQANNYSAITDVLIQIPSPDRTKTDEEYTKSRIAFYSNILSTKASLGSIAAEAGVGIDDLDNRIVISTPENSTLVAVRVSNSDSELAAKLSESVAAELARRIASIEAPRADVEILGTEITPPTDLTLSTAVRNLIAADPMSVAASPENALSLFGETELQQLSQDLGSILTPEQLNNAVTLTSGLPSTTTQVEPATPEQLNNAVTLTSGLPSTTTQVEPATQEQLGTITVTATGSDPDTVDRIASESFVLFQNKISTESGISEPTNSPLVFTGETSAADNVLPAASPNSRLNVNIILGLLIGAALSLGYAFFRTSQDTTLRNARQLVELTGELPIGIISKMTQPGPNPPSVIHSDTSLPAENYRALRANLMFGLPDVKVICLTPAGDSDMATTGINLAAALSQAGQSVILVETNLHKPELTKTLNLKGSQGLNAVLTRTCNAQDAIELWSPGGISVLSPKRAAINSAELLSTETFTKLIDELRNLFSYVVVVTPAALNSTDAAIVARRCDATLLLTECDKSTTDQLEIAVTSLLQVGAHIAGVVVTQVPPSEVNSWRAAHVTNAQPAS